MKHLSAVLDQVMKRQNGGWSLRHILSAESSRSARALATALVALTNRVLSIVGTLVTYPLVLHSLGVERFGLWVTLSSFVVYLRLVDAGTTSGFQVLVSQAHGAGRADRIKVLASSAYAILAFVGAALVVLAIVALLLDLTSWLDLSDPKLGLEASVSAALIIFGLALNYPAQVARQLRLGLQQGAAANAWDALSTALMFAGQLAAILAHGGLVPLVAVTALTPPLVNTVNTISYWWRSTNERPQRRLVDKSVCKSIGFTGVSFVFLGLAQALAIQIDTPLVATTLGVRAVADYAIVMKLFIQPQVLLMFFLAAQFPAYGEALAGGDFDWIRRHFVRTLVAGFGIVVILCLGLYICAKPLLTFWIGHDVNPPEILVKCAALFGVASATSQIFVYFLFSIGQRSQIIIAHCLMIPLNIALALLLMPQIGSAGACLAGAVGYIFVLLIPNVLCLRGILHRLPNLRLRGLEKGGLYERANERSETVQNDLS